MSLREQDDYRQQTKTQFPWQADLLMSELESFGLDAAKWVFSLVTRRWNHEDEAWWKSFQTYYGLCQTKFFLIFVHGGMVIIMGWTWIHRWNERVAVINFKLNLISEITNGYLDDMRKVVNILAEERNIKTGKVFLVCTCFASSNWDLNTGEDIAHGF